MPKKGRKKGCQMHFVMHNIKSLLSPMALKGLMVPLVIHHVIFARLLFMTRSSLTLSKRFLGVCSTSLLKTLWKKEKLLVTSNFSISHSVFYPFGELSAIFIKFKIVVCKLFQFGRVKNLSFGKWLNSLGSAVGRVQVFRIERGGGGGVH